MHQIRLGEQDAGVLQAYLRIGLNMKKTRCCSVYSGKLWDGKADTFLQYLFSQDLGRGQFLLIRSALR